MTITRRQFLGATIGFGAAAATLAACGDDGGGGGGNNNPDAPGRNCAANGTSATIGSNHGHTLTVSAADVAAGVDKTYDITGTSTHAHSVTITAANFASLQSNPSGSLMLTSTSGGGHTHSVTILCA